MIKVNGSIVNSMNFPDGTKLIAVDQTNSTECFITWLYDNDEELFQLIALTKHLKQYGCKITLHMPYIPNARMDRVKKSTEVFTLKWFAETINWLGFEKVFVSNPHSSVSEALINNVIVDMHRVYSDVDRIVNGIDESIEAIYFPDEGACKRYGDLLKDIDLPVAFGMKKRDWNTGKILGIDVVGEENIKNKNVLMVDDICAYGGTFYYSAIRMKELGAKDISCYVTHLENSVLDKEKGKLLNGDLIKKIYATNSIFRGEHNKINVINVF